MVSTTLSSVLVLSFRDLSRSVSCSSPTAGGMRLLLRSSRAEGRSEGLSESSQRITLATFASQQGIRDEMISQACCESIETESGTRQRCDCCFEALFSSETEALPGNYQLPRRLEAGLPPSGPAGG